jgi:hypothetical protein
MPYVALSYVWGDIRIMKTTSETLSNLQQPGSLRKGQAHNGLRIPRTTTDAMGFVRAISERYLWVDSLCIVQDEDESKQEQINNMGAIYGNATLTIIAAEGHDANYGLRGIPEVSMPRRIGAKMYPLATGAILVPKSKPWESFATPDSDEHRWVNRGWTFQEIMLSPRWVMFDQTVVWKCSNCLWLEEEKLSRNVGLVNWLACFTLPGTSLTVPKKPELKEYFDIVNEYNKRCLTFPEDAMSAFAGILGTLQPVFRGGFVSGLPHAFFDESLLWQPEWNQPLKRREAIQSSRTDACLPSWSWIGWQGHIAFSVIEDYAKTRKTPLTKYFRQEEVIPIFEWTGKVSRHSAEVPIQSHFSILKGNFYGVRIAIGILLRGGLGIPTRLRSRRTKTTAITPTKYPNITTPIRMRQNWNTGVRYRQWKTVNTTKGYLRYAY